MTKIKYEKLKLTTLVILVFSLVLLVIGVTYAVCSNLILGSTENILQAGTLKFSFNEGTFNGNGINIQNAMPITDNSGKLLNSTSQYFDFSVNAMATIAPLSYKVLVVKQSNSTLNDENIKIYLTLKDGSNEIASPLVMNDSRVLSFNELKSFGNNNSKIVYTGIVEKSPSEYNQDFRLRMWVSEDTVVDSDYPGKTFSIKVKVVASE